MIADVTRYDEWNHVNKCRLVQTLAVVFFAGTIKISSCFFILFLVLCRCREKGRVRRLITQNELCICTLQVYHRRAHHEKHTRNRDHNGKSRAVEDGMELRMNHISTRRHNDRLRLRCLRVGGCEVAKNEKRERRNTM